MKSLSKSLWIIAVLLILSSFFKIEAPKNDIPWHEFNKIAESNGFDVKTPIEFVVSDGTMLQKVTAKKIDGKAVTTKAYMVLHKDLEDKFNKLGYLISIKHADPGFGGLITLLPTLLILGFLMFMFFKQSQMMKKGPGFGKSKAKIALDSEMKVTFNDVAGIEEALEEVEEVVDFLKNPAKFQKIGGRIPRGFLLVGPPGTGKTLLAKAIAGEAGVPFYSTSGADFVEMFVGVGASRVRDMFEEGKKNAPCLIFIDEIDSIGRKRGGSAVGAHEEREQSLNALLVEMDGFGGDSGVIIVGATNRPDVLDPALLRPGRFDRQITVNLPDAKGREAILKVHAKNVKIHPDVDFATIAKGCPGYSGAELSNVINEAAILTARQGRGLVEQKDLEEAKYKVRWGKERRSLSMTEKDKRITAFHEAGHAVLLELQKNTDKVHKVTIIPRGQSLGATMYLPENDNVNYSRNQLLEQLVVDMGGRVAEEIEFGDYTTGASGDIRHASRMARRMVSEWGMSPLGPIELTESSEGYLGFDGGKSFSEKTASAVDEQVSIFVTDAYNKAKKLITDNWQDVENIAEVLLEKETIDGDEVRAIMGKCT